MAMIGIFALVSFFSYYSEQYLIRRINDLLINNIQLKNFSTNIDNAMTYLEKYLISRNFDMLREYYRYAQAIDSEYDNLTIVAANSENYLLLENIRNMTRSFLAEADQAEQAKRARDGSGYNQAFLEVVRYGTNIKWAIDRLITNQLEENSHRHLLISNRLILIQRLGLFLVVGAILFSIGISIWTSSGITRPVQKLADAAQTISKGNFAIAPLTVSTNDEIGVVTQAFNEMAASIAKLITEIKSQTDLEIRLQEQELQNLSMKNVLREAELLALQSQINPHFLFNVLNAGVQLAIMENADKTADFVEKVSTLLRYNLQKLDKPVTIQAEANHLETYFFILKTRYGNSRFQFIIDIDPRVANFQIPLLTLQPIVENALIHGVEDMENGGIIKVVAFPEGPEMIIEVSDNGRGMDSETLAKLLTGKPATSHTTGLGLHNVRERLHLFFRKENLLTIESQPGQGTTVRLRLPGNGLER
jgi:sensor histidine kinase YesM